MICTKNLSKKGSRIFFWGGGAVEILLSKKTAKTIFQSTFQLLYVPRAMANQHRNFLRSSVIFVAVFVAYECCFGTTFTGTHTRSTPPGGARNCVALKGSAVGVSEMFEDFTKFLKMKQEVIIGELESIENEEHRFTHDPWGCFLEEKNKSGGLTRVLQGGTVIEKGACSFTVIRGGLLSAERAKSISARQGGDLLVQAGDAYAAAALSTWEGGSL